MKIPIILIGVLTLNVVLRGLEEPEDYISIDCGAQNDYYDGKIGIHYKNDAGFVDSGINMQVSSEVYDEKHDQRSKNLRSFPNGTRNCYTLQPKQGKGNSYLIRASFWYGNYDEKNQPPVFDLYIDTNYWITVEYSSYYGAGEVIYVAPRDYIHVCLVNKGQGIPFISDLDLRLFNIPTYKIPSSKALLTTNRFNLGSMTAFRHPQDDYDRIWQNVTYSNWTTVTNTTPIDTPTSKNTYKVPDEVLMSAREVDINDTILFYSSNKVSSDWYAYFHFAEVQDLKGKVREMEISTMGKYVDTIHLQNQVPKTVVSRPTTGVYFNFTVKATARSDLPPLLNAVEIFIVLNLHNSLTNLSDFDGINSIKSTYGIVKESWQGDPCVPQNMIWEGLNCNYDDIASRIISLNLSSSNLVGRIAASFSNFTAITSFLDDNGIDSNSTTNVEKRNTNNVLLIVAPIIGLALLILFGAVVVFWCGMRKRRGLASVETSTQSKLKAKNRPFTYNEVVKVTNNFNTIIGQGGFGNVYFGILDNGDKVAVKMPSLTSKQGYKQFEAEAQLLMVTHHINLVALVGYCDDIKNMALIYEYMPRGNLREHLSEKNDNELSWIQRLQIAMDAAKGLNYLHHGCKPPIIHRDLKTSNILLNENMQAKIADFGLSKAFRTENESHISTCPAGTPGYLDPEFHSSGSLSRKSDIYSFGIILFELITGHSAFLRGPQGKIHILHWVTPFIQNGDVESIMDPRLNGQFNINSTWKALEIAMSCVPTTAIQRPDITQVLQELRECLNMELSGSHESYQMATLELDFDSTPLAR